MTEGRRRLFVAVRPPDDVLDAVERATAPARRSMVGPRWTKREQWHLTLQFLGWVDDVDTVSAALEALAARPAFAVRLGGGGAFPSERRGRVVWLGTTAGGDALEALASAVAGLLRQLGHEPEDRAVHPHLTLARLQRPADVRTLVGALGTSPVGADWTVREVILYESILRREGARYEPWSRIALEG